MKKIQLELKRYIKDKVEQKNNELIKESRKVVKEGFEWRRRYYKLLYFIEREKCIVISKEEKKSFKTMNVNLISYPSTNIYDKGFIDSIRIENII